MKTRKTLGARVPGRRVVCGALALAVVLGGGAYAGLGLAGDRGTAAAATMGDLAAIAGRIDLPWPGEGQTSIAVEGLGSLGSRGGAAPVPIASVAKVMTAYVILREHPLKGGEQGPRITVDATAAQESHSLSESTVPLREGQSLTQRQMLELLMLRSGNNVARLLARWDGGSQEAFVRKMNRAAKDLGMAATTYTGASGIEQSTRSTADDQLKLARAAMEQPVLRQVVGTRETTVPGISGPVVNTNKLLERRGVVGLKTGSTTPAGGNLMWAAEVRAGGKDRLAVGVTLAQRANTTPNEGMTAALERSGELIEALRARLPAALDGERAGRSGEGGLS
ncbi:D-alanyl-D-alanine carboxypeptidase [Streptomyces bambusae]|uniref:D-alanyl-D-alanine carboxypeptidase family protein n=1 Tax=Streptomyces bambusae TaxID=1550616 RepID=UPI001CFC4C1F|nr:serine hydrolase [Streptomyces bambusae]MCB5167444.1 D-alanyl-D-alanine carboxypeptidase [Streptomyces bambusae]